MICLASTRWVPAERDEQPYPEDKARLEHPKGTRSCCSQRTPRVLLRFAQGAQRRRTNQPANADGRLFWPLLTPGDVRREGSTRYLRDQCRLCRTNSVLDLGVRPST